MKKIFSLVLILCMITSLFLMLVSCQGTDEISTDGLSREDWEEAIADDNFDNVTILAEAPNSENGRETQTVKLTADKVYRTATIMINGTPKTVHKVFTGSDADFQRDMFLQVILSVLDERDNFEYDSENQVYLSKNAIKKEITIDDERVDKVTMTNGKVKFDAKGNLIYFECTLTESVYNGETLEGGHTTDTVWTFKDYGTTVITQEEINASQGTN